MPAPPRSRRWTLAICCAAFAGIGLPTAALGVAWPTLRVDLGRPIGDLGLLLVLMTLGYTSVALTHGALLRRVAPGRALAAAGLIYALGVGGLAVPRWPAVLVGALLLGAAVGEVESGLNAHVASQHSARAMNIVHGAFGVGATVGPLVVTELLAAKVSSRLLFAALAAGGAALGVVFLLTADRWVAAPPTARRRGRQGSDRSTGRSVAVLVGATLVVFVAYTGLETTTGQWSYTMLVDARGLDARTAGWVVSSFWAALTLGRFALGAIGARVTAAQVLDWSIPAALVVALVAAGGGGAVTAVAVVVMGLCFAGVFPALVTLTPARVGPARTSSVMGWQLAAGSVGVGLGPAVAAVGVERVGPASVGPTLVGLAAVMGVAHLVVRGEVVRRERARAVATAG